MENPFNEGRLAGIRARVVPKMILVEPITYRYSGEHAGFSVSWRKGGETHEVWVNDLDEVEQKIVEIEEIERA